MALRKNPRFDLKRKYRRTMELSFIFSLSLVLIAFKYTPEFEKVEAKRMVFETPTILDDVLRTEAEKMPKPPPKPPVPIEADIDDPTLPDIEFDGTEIGDISELPPPPAPKDDIVEEAPIFVWVENMPEPIGGIESIYKNLIYPEFAVRAGIQGSVILEAIVNENGILSDISIIKGIGGGCEEAAISALQQVLFNPGKQRGIAVKVKVKLPIRFVLQN